MNKKLLLCVLACFFSNTIHSRGVVGTFKKGGKTAVKKGKKVGEKTVDTGKKAAETGKKIVGITKKGGKFVAENFKAAYEYAADKSQEYVEKLKELEKLKKFLQLWDNVTLNRVYSTTSGDKLRQGISPDVTFEFKNGKKITILLDASGAGALAKKVVKKITPSL